MFRSAFLVAALLSTFASAQTSAQLPLQVVTTKGVVEGESTPDGKVLAFKGIPYAAPPVGNLRWAPPAPAAPWTGVRPAKDFAYRCVQSGSYPDMNFHDSGSSEDCLTLNVWAPAAAKPGSLPVMVWIYGGGLTSGSTSEHRQDGQFLAHRNVLVVSLNYRLGIFGFFTHPELAAESPHHASGNYGLLDQAAALQWVHDNIAAFGGDPANITLFGESAGSYSVSANMASPLSRGLFQKAIGESGGAVASVFPVELPHEKRETADAAQALTIYGINKLSDLRHLSTDDIIRPILASHNPPRFTPVIDGYFFPRPVAEIYAAGQQLQIPVLVGWNAGESQIGVVSTPFTAANFRAQAQTDFPTQSPEFLNLYPADTEAHALRSAIDYAGDKFIAYATWRWLESQVATGHSPVYRYRFELPNSGDRFHTPAAGAFHSDDIEYVFGTLDSRPETALRPEDRALSTQMQTYWTNFARTGDPNDPSLPKWPTYSPTTWNVMHLDATSAAAPDTQRARYLFLDKTWNKSR